MGTGDTIIADHEHVIITKLIEVSPQIANEIIKSVIFKLLIQIDRSSNLNEPELKKIIAYWVNIEFLALLKTYKNNGSQLEYLKRIISNLAA